MSRDEKPQPELLAGTKPEGEAEAPRKDQEEETPRRNSRDGLYVRMFSIHGLLRADNLELGRDADTGGQIKYVVELARNLGRREEVRRVDLFTRLIEDRRFSRDYARPVEEAGPGLRIVRIQCGGRKYLRKELLWPHLDEYIDRTIKYTKRTGEIPDLVHGHYPDAGRVAMELALIFDVPFLYTGHSTGRAKRKRLAEGGMSPAEMARRYLIDHRIAVEEEILRRADLVVTSTSQEVEEQYGLYRNGNIPSFKVIPPGIALDRFYPYYHDLLPESASDERVRYGYARMVQELHRFFRYPEKPLILALSRPDKRKNISGLVRAYGGDPALQAMANLAVFAGIRKDIDRMDNNEREVLTRMLLLMDKYDLYGKMAIPKHHEAEYEVPALYRIAAEKRGVFVNPALTEPFGLTLLEASASGLPIVATNDGGPRDIMANLRNGILVDPTAPRDIAEALKSLITDGRKWDAFSKNGVINVCKHYTWSSHAERYVEEVAALRRARREAKARQAAPSDAIGHRLARLNRFLVTDIDNTLIREGDSRLGELLELLAAHRESVGFAVATGRTVESAVEVLAAHGIPHPDILITSVGAEIHYGSDLHFVRGWETRIADHWERDKIRDLLDDFDFLRYQPEAAQRRFKISYDMEPGKDRLARIHERLSRHGCRYNLIYSHHKYLDILPWRASKGKALRYLGHKWEIPSGNFVVCGDSGNDEEMLRGGHRGVVVAGYSPELENLRGRKWIFFTRAPGAGGILEGIEHYRLLAKARKDGS